MIKQRAAALTGVGTILVALLSACREDKDVSRDNPSTTEHPAVITPVDVKTSEAASIIRIANQGEVEQANAALNRLKSDGARSFAKQMITQHGESQEKLERLMTSNHIQMQETDTTRELKAASDRSIRAVQSADDADADRAYINTQINGHEELLKKLDEELIPNTPDSELKQFLKDLRPVVAMHLEHAQRVKTDLMLQGTTSEGTAAPGPTDPGSQTGTATTPGAKGPVPGTQGTQGSQGTNPQAPGMHGGPTPRTGTERTPATPGSATRSPAGSQNQGSGTQGSGSQSSGTQGSQTGGAGR